MRAFFGGMIREDCRGNLSVVVAKEASSKKYGVFLYAQDSEEFLHLTGPMAVRNPLERVYIGVSHETGEKLIRRMQDKSPGEVDLQSIDSLVVWPHFVNEPPSFPNKIVLEATAKGEYRLTELK